MSAKQTIAVIGASGNRGAAISKILAKGNNRLLLIANEKEKVENVAQYITNNTASAEVEVLECPTDASWEADLIILAVPYQVEKEIAEKKAAYQSGQAYRNGSDDVIDVNYVEKDENE